MNKITDSPTREQAEALKRLEACVQWGGPLPRVTDVAHLLAVVSLLVTERDADLAEIQRQQDLWTAQSGVIGDLRERAEAAEAQVAALVRAINEERGWATGTAEHNDARTTLYELARQAEALAGGGRTPTGTDSGGLGLSAEAVAEVSERASRIRLLKIEEDASDDLDDRIGCRHFREQAERDLGRFLAVALTTATVSPPESVSPGAADEEHPFPPLDHEPETT